MRDVRLTVDADIDPLADRRGYTVGGDAEVDSHIQSADFLQFQARAFHFRALLLHQ
jgi:hypothetical protein